MPHPRNDPKGHSYAEDEEYLPHFAESDWAICIPYLYGVDLFNNGYWWEAHEAWETVWIAAGRKTPTGTFIQGLIQVAAGQLKRLMDEPEGATLLSRDGLAKLTACNTNTLGIDVPTLTRKVLESLNRDNDQAPVIHLYPPPSER